MNGKYKYLFIVTYGRSGSTLLQGILNSIPGYLIRGENNGVMIQLRSMYLSVSAAKNKFSSIGKTSRDAWYGIDRISNDQLLASIRRVIIDDILTATGKERCVGFKEIRYAPNMIGNLDEFLSFMESVFPECCFVFNERSISSTVHSGFWKNREDATQHLEGFRDGMRIAYEARENRNAYWVRYEKYINNPEVLSGLFAFLHEPFSLSSIYNVLSKRHSA